MGAKRFVRTLVERGMAVEYALPNYRGGARACRISNKEIYRKLGIENVRHRRDADDSVMLRRLLSLDYVLEYPELPWLAYRAGKGPVSLSCWASTASCSPTASIREP